MIASHGCVASTTTGASLTFTFGLFGPGRL